MKTSTLRQRHYRARLKLERTLREIAALKELHGNISLHEALTKTLEAMALLETNKRRKK